MIDFALINLSIYNVLKLSTFAVMANVLITRMTVREFLVDVGRADFQKATGLRQTCVQRAINENVFPDRWIWKIRPFCHEMGLATPEHLFRGHPYAQPTRGKGGEA